MDRGTSAVEDAWRDLVVPGPWDSVLERLAHVVAARGHHVAVDWPGGRLTFSELAARAVSLAHRVRDLVPDGDDPVAVLAEQGADTVTALLAALLVARPVALLDPLLPAERLRQLLDQSQAALLLLGDLPAGASAELQRLGQVPVPTMSIASRTAGVEQPTDATAVLQALRRAAATVVADTDPVSIVFTSGSTGSAKGVVLTHRTVLAGAFISRVGLGIGPEDRVALVLPHAFAAGQEVAFMALLNGAELHVYDPRTRGMRSLAPWLHEHRPTTVHATPSLLRALLAALHDGEVLDGVRLVTTCGESVHGRDVAMLRPHVPGDAVFTSWMGASEVGQLAFYPLAGDVPVPDGVVPVGSPVPLKEVSILDDAGAPVPTGAPGSVHVTSAHLSGGYWRDPERTAAVFTPTSDGRVRYATGDRGWMGDDGALHLVGREDDAVKVRGYLVEPAEVEAALLALDGVGQAVVRGRRPPGSDPAAPLVLVGYVVPDARTRTPSAAQLRRELRTRLPEWMVPSALVLLPGLPLNERGKLDATRLPAPPARPQPRPASSSWEESIGRTWADVLGLDGVDARESFSELGGDSLATEEVLARVQTEHGVDLTASDLAEHPSLEEFAALVAQVASRAPRPPRPHRPTTVALRRTGTGLPVFCFAGAAGDAAVFTDLAAALGPAHAVHAFEVNGLNGRGRLDLTVAANARRHLPDLLEIAPDGPVVLVGHSLGGLFALEAAHLLDARGRPPALLALLDTNLPPSAGGRMGPETVLSPASAVNGRPVSGGSSAGDERMAEDRRRRSALRMLAHTLRAQDRRTLFNRLGLLGAGWMRYGSERKYDVFWQHGLLLTRLARLRPWAGPSLVLTSTDNTDAPELWDAVLTGPHRVLPVVGDHNGILRPPHVAATAAAVRDALEDLVGHQQSGSGSRRATAE